MIDQRPRNHTIILEERKCTRCYRQTEQELRRTYISKEVAIPVWYCLTCGGRPLAGPSEGYKSLRGSVDDLPLFHKPHDYQLFGENIPFA